MALRTFTVESVTAASPTGYDVTYCDPAKPNEHYECKARAANAATVDAAIRENHRRRKAAEDAAALPKTRTATVDV